MVYRSTTLTLSVFLLAAGCGESTPTPGAMNAGALVPDFMLEDVNATSPTFGDWISPRHHLGKVSAWYFGHST